MKPVRSLEQVKDRDFFSIIDDNGEKSIHIHGYVWESDNDGDADWRKTDYTFCIVPLPEFIRRYAEQGGEYIDLLAMETKQYEDDITSGEALSCFNNYYESMDPVEELSYGDITVDTPYGDYVEPVAFDKLAMHFMNDAVARIARIIRTRGLHTVHCSGTGDEIPVRLKANGPVNCVQVQWHGEWVHVSEVLSCGEIITAACMDDGMFAQFIGSDTFRSRPKKVTLSDSLASFRREVVDRIAEKLSSPARHSGSAAVSLYGHPVDIRLGPACAVEVSTPGGWRDILQTYPLEAVAELADSL